MEKKRPSPSFIVYVIAVFLLLAVVLIRFFPKPFEKAVYMDKDSMFEIVRSNEAIIRSDIAADRFDRTLQLLSSSREKPRVFHADSGCIDFYCYGWGMVVNGGYEGFYYSPWDGPANLNNIVPTDLFPDPSVPETELDRYFVREGNGWAWYEDQTEHGGDNVYYTEKICDNFWYYRLEY